MDRGRMKQRLLEERRLLEEQIKRIEDWSLSDEDSWSGGELSSYDQHPADQGSETYEREKDIGLRAGVRSRLQKITEALEKLETGDYGICSQCGAAIAKERLEVIPYASLCYDCKKIEEARNDDEIRTKDEHVLRSSYSFYNREREYVGFDGEDTWQSVARFGTANSSQDVLEGELLDADEDVGTVDELDALVDIRGNGVSDLDAIYPDPADKPMKNKPE